MNTEEKQIPHLLWVYPGALDEALDSVTWIETTRTLRRMGWHVTLITADDAQHSVIRGVEVLGLPTRQIYFLRQFDYHLHLLRYLIKMRRSADVVLFHSISAAWLLPLKLVQSLIFDRRPLYVMDTRDLHPMGGNWKDALRRVFLRLAHFLANRGADGQTAISPRMAALVNIPADQFWGVWPSGVIADQFATAHEKRTWPTGNEIVQLVYIGRLLLERNLLALGKSVLQANKEGMAFRLSLIGDGVDRHTFENFAKRSAGQIQLLDPVPHQEMPQMLAKMHVGITSLPAPDDARYAASSPVKLFEYMAAGMPVLATSNPCHTEVIGDGDYAFWAEDAHSESILDALRAAWKARDTFARRGAHALQAANVWTWKAATAKLDDALRKGIAENLASTPEVARR